MRILLTGATGFLGSRIATLAVRAGHEVVALVRASSSLARLTDAGGRISMATLPDGPRVPGRSLGDAIGDVAFDAVIHSAATYARYDEPMSSIIDTNVVLGLELLSLCGPRVGAFVNIGTALPPEVSRYAVSKRQFSSLAMLEAEREGWPFTNLAVELMYGPGDPPNRLIASLVLACLGEAPRIPLTDGTQIRDFIYVDDVAHAALVACEVSVRDPARRRLDARVGTGIGIEVRAAAEAVKREIGAHTTLDFGALALRPNEVLHSVSDGSAQVLLGWQPEVPLEEGLRRTIAWYHATSEIGSPT